MGLSGPSKTTKVEPLRRTAPAPEPARRTPEREPAPSKREKEKV